MKRSMKKTLKLFLVFALVITATMSFSGCGKTTEKLDYKTVSATNVWEQSAKAITASNQTPTSGCITIDMESHVNFMGHSETVCGSMGLDIENGQMYAITNAQEAENMNSYFVDGKYYYNEGGSKYYISSKTFQDLVASASGESSIINGDFSDCQTYEQFVEKLKITLSAIDDTIFGEYLLGIEDISLSGKEYDDGKAGLVISSSYTQDLGDGTNLTIIINIEIISKDGVLLESRVGVVAGTLMDMEVNVAYHYNQFDSSKMPTAEELAEYQPLLDEGSSGV